MASCLQDLPRIYLLLENPKKSNNLGPILRCASAFGILTVVAVGFSKCSVEGSHGASKHVQIINFPVGDQAIDFIRNECQCSSVVGLMGPLPNGYDHAGYAVDESEASDRALFRAGEEASDRRSFPVDAFAFSKGNICFAVSKGRQGLPLSLARLCDSFVHIPHMTLYTDEELLLDTPSCLSILLHEFTNWAGYDERNFQGHKFDVARPTWMESENDDAMTKQNERTKEKANTDEAVEKLVNEEGTLDTIFGAGNDGDY